MFAKSMSCLVVVAALAGFLNGCEREDGLNVAELQACEAMVQAGLRPVADDRSRRFLGKVEENTALCRGGEGSLAFRSTPWVDWANYRGAGDASTLVQREARTRVGEHLLPNGRGIDGALMDLEYQRIELIKFNLFDNYSYESYVRGRDGLPGSALKQWPEMRLGPDHPNYAEVGGAAEQLCGGELIRFRTLSGICNDIRNPLMGSTGTLFARNVAFEATFPDLSDDPLALARHGDAEHGKRLGLLKPDPQLISRGLFTRPQDSATCKEGRGLPDFAAEADCDYAKAPFFNVLAAFWIQFMIHDWFSHLDEGRNAPGLVPVGCASEEAQRLGCRPGDRMEAANFLPGEEGSFEHEGREFRHSAQRNTRNTVTAWWDASQIYGYDELSARRVLRDPEDPAKLLQPKGYLPVWDDCRPGCPVQPQWEGQEAAAFPDNWNIGLSFYHNLFVREHNSFVERFRRLQQDQPDADSGLRDPADKAHVIPYAQASDEEIFQAARLVVAAMIAKIHTVEWTPQLLYNEPLYRGMNSNWFGLFDLKESEVSQVLRRIVGQDESLLSRLSARAAGWLGRNSKGDASNSWYSVFASGAGIFGLNNRREEGLLWWKRDVWDLGNPDDVNGGTNHFGSPFNFPEEFTSVYRLHPLMPDLIEYREWERPNEIAQKIPVTATVRGGATAAMQEGGIGNWALSMGRQRLGLLQLNNHPLFLQNLDMPHLASESGKIDVLALDIIRDRERGIPRFNEFRRQIGLQSLRGFDDFVDQRLPKDAAARKEQEAVVERLREIYGTHVCDASKVISEVQRDAQGQFINDCLGHPDGTVVDNIEDLDTMVGWLAEYTRPHGFAISETQFHIFILNASRRLFSDRFFTSSFRPEFYSQLGYDWVLNNGPLDDCPFPLTEARDDRLHCLEPAPSNGHVVSVSPLKRVLLRNVPELRDELLPVVNAFDPWARDRGEYYSLDWTPRPGAESDPAFQ